MATTLNVDVRAPVTGRMKEILTPQALDLVARLHREFEPTRRRLLREREERQKRIVAGEKIDFLTSTRPIREGGWQAAPAPKDLRRRWVEITGPTDRKMIINALNSGADVYMADFEDANTPTWENMILGHANLIDAVERTITFRSPEGKEYRLGEKLATLLVRPRGWHLPERHLAVGGEVVAGAFVDFGLFMFHCARRLIERGSGPYLYLPKLESHREARLWNEVFNFTQDALGIPRGTIRGTVLVETILAAFEMEEILYELREHAGGLNAGRWDYIFSLIKKLRHRDDVVLPDRIQVTMTVPFMRAYTELLVKTCHTRGAFALGGMAAYIPSRRDAKVNELALAKVREDKVREATDGFDGTWVAHPDLVPVARAEFERILAGRDNQLQRKREEVSVGADAILDIHVPGGTITEQGLRNDVSVGIQYLESWLRGGGAVAIFNLMEDAATCEIARSQIWQWTHHGAKLTDGTAITPEVVRRIEKEELAKIESAVGAKAFRAGRYGDAVGIFEQVALSKDFVEFLTLPAYEHVD